MSAENLVPKNEVSKKSSVRVGEIETLLHHNVSIVSQICVEGIVLQFWGVQICTRVLINSIVSHYSLEKFHSEVVRIVVSWNYECGSNAHVRELVVSAEHQGRSEERLFAVVNLSFNILLYISEMLIYSFVDGLGINVAHSRNNNIISNIVF